MTNSRTLFSTILRGHTQLAMLAVQMDLSGDLEDFRCVHQDLLSREWRNLFIVLELEAQSSVSPLVTWREAEPLHCGTALCCGGTSARGHPEATRSLVLLTHHLP